MTMYNVSVKQAYVQYQWNDQNGLEQYSPNMTLETECGCGCGWVVGQAGKPNVCVLVQGDRLMHVEAI